MRTTFQEAAAPNGDVGGTQKISILRVDIAALRQELRHLRGLIISNPEKSDSLSVTTTQLFAPATEAMIISIALRGRPAAFPSAINRAQIKAAFSSKEKMRPANNSCGPSDPENQASRSSRFFPRAFSRIPRRISATVSVEMNKSSSRCSTHHARSSSEGFGFVTLLMMLVSRRKRVTNRPGALLRAGAKNQDQH